jgi:hypothetical protein
MVQTMQLASSGPAASIVVVVRMVVGVGDVARCRRHCGASGCCRCHGRCCLVHGGSKNLKKVFSKLKKRVIEI